MGEPRVPNSALSCGLCLIRREVPKPATQTLVSAPPGKTGKVFFSNVPAHLMPLAQAVFFRQDFIWTSSQNLFSEKAGLAILSLEVSHIYAKGKDLFKAVCRFEDGSQETMLFSASQSKGRFAGLAGQYKAVCQADPEHRFVHQWGAETEVCVTTPGTGKTNYTVFSVDFLPGESLDKEVGHLEQRVGVPGLPGPLKTTETELRQQILTLDREALQAQVMFWEKTGYVQSDPRRNNIIFHVDANGQRTYKIIDYDSLIPDKSLGYLIAAFDIFNPMIYRLPGFTVTDASVRPWVWTYQENQETRFPRSTFFSAIWESLPQTRRQDLFLQALREVPRHIAPHIASYLAEIGVIGPSPTPSIIKSA